MGIIVDLDASLNGLRFIAQKAEKKGSESAAGLGEMVVYVKNAGRDWSINAKPTRQKILLPAYH